ncbi:MAG: hypothetical protein HYU36_15655 [Planctomycetes bacterium]|nr:hypothetical protein [Planctomycetota bacterium]
MKEAAKVDAPATLAFTSMSLGILSTTGASTASAIFDNFGVGGLCPKNGVSHRNIGVRIGRWLVVRE